MNKKFRNKRKNPIREYVYDLSIDIKDRTFVAFSVIVLIALFAAIPTGIIMHEPVSATLSTAAGAIFFLFCVVYSVKNNKIDKARIGIAFVVVFIFLPAMIFTNGGIESGTPLWLLLGTIYIAMILDGNFKETMLALEAVVMIMCWTIAYYHPEIIDSYTRWGNYFDTIAGLFIISFIIYMIITFQGNLIRKEKEGKSIEKAFSQTAIALVNAIDEKDRYTKGHSMRVADYAKRIAQWAGKSENECEEIYHVALLHDVGMMGVPEDIISKEGPLTEEEYEIVKTHCAFGAKILESVTDYPYMSVGAHFHHEHYDGTGYPNGLKGKDIPEIARIIAVADAYDAMTSKRSYRKAIPQTKAREELIEGSGSQFDPEFASIMIHLIDVDSEYEMSERDEIVQTENKNSLVSRSHRDKVYEGILLLPNITKIDISMGEIEGEEEKEAKPSLVLFDSLDGLYHDEEREVQNQLYYEYAEVYFDGTATVSGARKTETEIFNEGLPGLAEDEYHIEAVRRRDHALVRIFDKDKTVQVIIALPDSTRYAYIGLTGENCFMENIVAEKMKEEIGDNYIPRIAEEVSYINVPAGDVPNVQIDGYRTDSTDGIPVTDGLAITFHTKSLPTARLVWHCPSFVLFASDDGKINGPNYKEYSYIRLDGENWEAEKVAVNKLIVERQNFQSWDVWREINKEGYECTITFNTQKRRVVSCTSNCGISIRTITEIKSDAPQIYVALSGDQCALTNIRINRDGAAASE